MSQTNPQNVKQNRRDKQQRREAERLRVQQRQRRNAVIIIGVIVLLVLVIGISIWRSMSAATGTNTATNTQSTPAPAPVAYTAVNGITCDSQEQGTYHVHAHLSMYVNGKAVPLPQTIGIAGDNSCIYWLHTHDTSGVIHIEAPAQRSFLLGDFMQLWKQRFSSLNYLPQLDQAAGWKAYVDGKPFTGDFHNIKLQAHTLVTLAYNSPNVKPDTSYAWQGL